MTGAAAAAVVGWFSIRQRGAYFVMLTLAFGQMFYFLAYTTPELTGGDNGLLDIPRPALSLFGRTLVPIASPWQYYGFVAVLFLIAFWLMMRVSHSVFGRTLLAIRDNEARAAAVGYDVKRFKLAAFVVSGAVTGLAGALPRVDDGIAPLSNIDYHTSEMILVMTVIGGTGNLFVGARRRVLCAVRRLALHAVATLAAAARPRADRGEPLHAARAVGPRRTHLAGRAPQPGGAHGAKRFFRRKAWSSATTSSPRSRTSI